LTRVDRTQRATRLGQVQLYVGSSLDIDDVRRYRDLFGGVTLQGHAGLRIAERLRRDGDLRGVDLDPAVYLDQRVSNQLTFDFDLEPFDWIRAQRDLGLAVVRSAGRRIRVGRVEDLRHELAVSYASDVRVVLVLDDGWMGSRHIDALEQQLMAADRDVSLIFAACFDPLDSANKMAGLRRVLRWSRSSGRMVELLRTDPAGIVAATEGTRLAAIGIGTSTRHYGLPLPAQQRPDYVRRQHSPLVFLPSLLHWQRGAVLAALVPWGGAGITNCECTACESAGQDLTRFGRVYGSIPREVTEAIREHDVLALAAVVRSLVGSPDAAAALKQRCSEAVRLGRSVAASFKVRLDPPPAWQTAWA